MVTSVSRAERRVSKKELKRDVVKFVLLLWQWIESDKVAPIGPPEIEILKFMAGQDTGNRRGVLAPRGIGKTYLALAYIAWRFYCDPELKIKLVSKTDAAAAESLQLIRGWFETVPFLKHLKPNKSIKHRDTTKHFDVGGCVPRHRSPSFTIMGINGQLEGSRANLILADDCETEVNARTPMERLKVASRVKEFTHVCSFGLREIIFLGTYHHPDSLYLKLAKRQYVFRTWPILIPHPDQMVDDQGRIRMINPAPSVMQAMREGTAKPGDKVFPHRHDDARIKELKAEGEYDFDMQQMLLIHNEGIDEAPLRCEDLIVMDAIDRDTAPLRVMWGLRSTGMKRADTTIDDLVCDGFGDDCFRAPAMISEDWVQYQDTVMWIDPSGRGKDKTGYAVVSLLNGFLWIKAVGGLDGGYSTKTLDRLCAIAKMWGATTAVVEDEGGYGAVAPLLEARMQRIVSQGRSTRPSGQISGPEAVDDQRKHLKDRHQGRWMCKVITQHVTKLLRKEERICDVLEPPLSSHRLVTSREVAGDDDFILQFTRITREKNCLDHDDRIDALAGAVSYFADEMGVIPEETPQEKFKDEVQTFLEEAEAAYEMMTTVGRSTTVIRHR
tara:strand:+ start:4222 stop:6054 length:1833 start_codon:yes stop_codon:yes gene_type:complete